MRLKIRKKPAPIGAAALRALAAENAAALRANTEAQRDLSRALQELSTVLALVPGDRS